MPYSLPSAVTCLNQEWWVKFTGGYFKQQTLDKEFVAQEWFTFLIAKFWELQQLCLHIAEPVYISTAIPPKTAKNLKIDNVTVPS